MFKVIKIEGHPTPMKSSGLTYRIYRKRFGKDLLNQIKLIDTEFKENESIENVSEVAEQVAWTLAKTANKDLPDIDEWLDTFKNPNSIVGAMGDVLQLITISNETSVKLKKNQTKSQGKKKNQKTQSTN